jgi:hypothetical protein
VQYLVYGTGGPAFHSSDEVVSILEDAVLPGFEHLSKLESAKKIVAGGVPVGERALVFIIEAASNDEADQMLRDLPFWGLLEWDVSPLQSFANRAAKERSVLQAIKAGSKG